MKRNPDLENAMYGTVRETAIIPRQSINLAPSVTIAGVQVRQLQVADSVPTPIETPINTQRISVGTGNFRFYVQFFHDPSDTSYASTSVFLRSANGTTSLQSEGNKGPIAFTASASNIPSAIGISLSTTSGTSSSSDFGSGHTRGIDLT